jgi:Zn finger protein HypA/HybF involved in hydrogenase expression
MSKPDPIEQIEKALSSSRNTNRCPHCGCFMKQNKFGQYQCTHCREYEDDDSGDNFYINTTGGER